HSTFEPSHMVRRPGRGGQPDIRHRPPPFLPVQTTPALFLLSSARDARGCSRASGAASVMSMRRGLPEKIGVHNPPLLSLGFASDPLDLVHAPLQVARDENLILGSDVGSPVDVDLRVGDVLERTFSIEHHNDVIAIIGQALRYLAPGGNMNRLSDAVQGDLMASGQRLNAAYSRNHFVFECNGSLGNDPIDDP